VFAGTLLIVLWAQICAQLVGVMGLKRLLGSGHATMGEVTPIPVPGVVAPPPEAPAPPPVPVNETPPSPVMGVPPKHHLMRKPAPPPTDKNSKMGKIAIRGLME
jgi:hypothetical protein